MLVVLTKSAARHFFLSAEGIQAKALATDFSLPSTFQNRRVKLVPSVQNIKETNSPFLSDIASLSLCFVHPSIEKETLGAA